MSVNAVAKLLNRQFSRRLPKMEHAMRHATQVQDETLKKLIRENEHSLWGLENDFKSLGNYEQYRRRVGLNTYEDLFPYIDRTMKGEDNVLCSSEIKWFAKSSGTTNDKSKFIPVSYSTLENCHYQAGRDILAAYFGQNPESALFTGRTLTVGGSHKVNPVNTKVKYGDLSAVMLANAPMWINLFSSPGKEIALLGEWEEKIERMARETLTQNITGIAGVPTWTLVLFEKLYELTGKRHMKDIWPELELYIHGGVSFVPYREAFKKHCGDIQFLETFNASEGFFGIQMDLSSPEMTLMTDYGIFYEFIPISHGGAIGEQAIPLWEVKTGVNYAIVISTDSGLWRYQLGDTIIFTETDPYRFKISGRTKLFINAFGEELVIENAEQALAEACRQTNAHIKDFTAAPIYFGQRKNEAGHEWLIEFEFEPDDHDKFTRILDETLKSLNSDYEAKRYRDLALKPPRVVKLREGTFNNWLKMKGKLGGQHKVPRLSNDRHIVDEILNLHQAVA